MIELKPCPFCGGEAMRTKTENTIQDTVWGCYHYGVSCSDPNCVGFDIVPRYRTYASADEAWNRRANDGKAD